MADEPIEEQDPETVAEAEYQKLIAEVEQQLAAEPETEEAQEEEEGEKEEDGPQFEITAAMKREILAMPASERAQYIEDLARSSGLEVKLPGESKDEQAVAQEAGKKAALNVSASKMVEELAANGYDFPEMHDPDSEGAYSTIAMTYMEMRAEQKVAAIEQQRQAAIDEQNAAQEYEAWKANTAPQVAEHFGNKDAAPAVLDFINGMTPQEVGMYFATNEDGSPTNLTFMKAIDSQIQQIVTDFAQSQEPDVKPPKAEPIGGRARDDAEPLGEIAGSFLDRMKNDPEFKETAGAFSKKIGARR